MALSQAERMRRELKKELGDWELVNEILHMVQRGEQSKLVDHLYERFISIAVEQAVVDGHFSIHRFFTIDAEDQQEDGSLKINAKVSDSIKLLRKAHLAGREIDRNNWRESIDELRKERKAAAKRNSEFFNPMIDEDDNEW